MTHPACTESRHGVALTVRQAEIFDFIVERIRAQQSPSVREIGRQFGINSPNGVTAHLRSLERKGLIVRRPDVSRGIQLVNKGPETWAHRVGNDVWLMDGPSTSGATRIGTMHYERYLERTGVELNGVPHLVRMTDLGIPNF